MAARSARQSFDEAIDAAVQAAITRALPSLRRAIDAAVAARMRGAPAAPRRAARRNVAVVRPAAVTRWVADRRARRVPTFVIEATGLDTKKQIVARYGENAAFAKGKALPHVRLAQAPSQPAKSERVVKAKPPIVRKAGAAK